MTGDDRRALILAFSLAVLAGYVDALGYQALRGFFVSFMSGNSTRLSIGLASGDRRPIDTAGTMIGLFLLGVVAGALAGRRRPVLGLVSAALALGALAASLGHDRLAIDGAAFAMGGANNVVQKAGRVSVSVTFMTGTLVRLGQGIAALLRRDDAGPVGAYALLWSALALGALSGGLVYPRLGLDGLWLAAIWCACLIPPAGSRA